MKEKEQYIDFDAYERAKEPHKREKAYYWATAIGLQKVDGLETSDYLKEVAQRNIEGEINIEKAQELVRTYYQSKVNHDGDNDDKQEADLASTHIAQLLSEPTFAFTLAGLQAIHKRIFQGIFKFAGKIRDYDITKKEWVLRGDTVLYVSAPDIRRAIEYDLEQEREFSYKDMSLDEMIPHIAKFVSGIWQIHPFGEGNTRTTAVFTIKYLRSLGFKVENDIFAKNAWYFRNALVRANYHNYEKNIDYNYSFIERFFRNLLLGEHNELKNRYMLINPPEEWKQTDPTSNPSSNPSSKPSSKKNENFLTDNEYILKLVSSIKEEFLSLHQIMTALGLKDRVSFRKVYLVPALEEGFIKMLHPENPKHPRQKYLLTVKGLALYNNIKEKNKR